MAEMRVELESQRRDMELLLLLEGVGGFW